MDIRGSSYSNPQIRNMYACIVVLELLLKRMKGYDKH